jgi:prephenate dehydrogenase
MGGSLALALARSGTRVVGVDPDDDARAFLASHLPDAHLAAAPGEELAACDLVVLAVPIGALERAAAAAEPWLREAAVVTDLTSLKAWPLERLAECLPGARLVGSHPMAGREHSGARFADADLFRGRPWALVAGQHADPAAVASVRALAEAVGATCVEIGAGAHDAAVAAASHLPYLVSGALARAVAGLARDGVPADALVGPGLEGMLRLAAQPPWMDDIAARNAAHVLAALRALQRELAAAQDALAASGAEPSLDALGEAGRQARDRLLGGRPNPGGPDPGSTPGRSGAPW